MSSIFLFMRFGGRDMVCQIQLAFAKTNLWKMLFVVLNVTYRETVHCLNIANVNIMRNLAYAVKENRRRRENADKAEHNKRAKYYAP